MLSSIVKLERLTHRINKLLNREIQESRKGIVLGIETSCDDTGCAIVDSNGKILGESLNSQHLIHLKNGGIIPPLAQDLHRKNIVGVVDAALNLSKLSINNIDAIAVTTKPGLPLSLETGTKYAKYLCQKYDKPLIPIHHMEAHALTARMHDKSIDFPFLVLLISGGHCLLAIAEKVDRFQRLGETIDDAPGEAFDKMSRRMKLRNLPEYAELSGGQAIEIAASKANNAAQFPFATPLTKYKNCNFSFAGIKNVALHHIIKEEKMYDVPADGVIPNVSNLCASFQMVVTRHICHRVQRAMEYVKRKNLIPPDNKTLVVSGGAACNNFIAKGIEIVCNEMDYKMVRPPPKLCTDNGVMIAWNGVERWKQNIGIFTDFDDVTISNKEPLGDSLIEDVINENISCDWIKISSLITSHCTS